MNIDDEVCDNVYSNIIDNAMNSCFKSVSIPVWRQIWKIRDMTWMRLKTAVDHEMEDRFNG